MKHVFAATLAAAALLPFAAHAQDATAKMINAEGQDIGTITLSTTPSGMLHIVTDLTGLPPGVHAFHIHETGTCDPATKFDSAGGHYAGGHEHGILVEGGPHAGDLPNVFVGDDGVLKVEDFTDRVSLAEGGENPLKDADGSAFVIHAKPDDYKSQPSGDAGDRIACGVVE